MSQHSAERERVATLLFYTFLLGLGYLVFRLFQPYLASLAWASIAVIVFHPMHRRLDERIGATAAASISTVAVMLMLVVPGGLLATTFVREATHASQSLAQAVADGRLDRFQDMLGWAQQRTLGLEGWDLGSLARTAAERVAAFIAGQAGTIVRNVAGFLVDLIIMLFATFFLFRDGRTLLGKLRRAIPFEAGKRDRIIEQTRDLVYASVVSTLVVAILQGALGGLAFAILGIGAPVLWGVVMAFTSLVPVVGSGIIWGPAAVYLLVSGSVARGLILVAIGVGMIGMVDNVVRPLILSGRTQLNGLLVLISLLGGIGLFGFIGVVLGPILVATGVGLLEAYTRDQGAEQP